MTSREFAIAAHGNQMYGKYPYVKHLDDTVAVLKELWKIVWGPKAEPEQDVIDVAYLHDVVEDTSKTPEDRTILLSEIEDHFGQYVAMQVALLTDPPGKNRRERKAKLYAQIARANIYTRLTKLADRIANMRNAKLENQDLYQMYLKESDDFMTALRSITLESAWAVYTRELTA